MSDGSNKNDSLRGYILVGHLYYALMIVLAVVFYKERVAIFEGAMFFWNILGVKDFSIYFNRYALMLTEILPLASIKMGFSLKHIMMAYSLSFPLLHYVVFLFCAYKLRNPMAAICIATLSCVGTVALFFFMTAGSQHGLVFLVCFYAWIIRYPYAGGFRIFGYYFVAFILMFLVVFSHSVLMILLVFMLLFFFIENGRWKQRKFYGLLGLFLLGIAYKILEYNSIPYEAGKISELFESVHHWPQFFSFLSLKFYLNHLAGITYGIPALMLIAIVTFYLMHKMYAKLLLVLSFNLITFLVISFCYYKVDSPFFLELIYLNLVALQVIPFMLDVAPFALKGKIGPGAIGLTMLISVVNMVTVNSKPFTDRIAYIKQTSDKLRKFPERLLIVDDRFVPTEFLKAQDGFPVECLLTNSIEHKDSALGIFVSHDVTVYHDSATKVPYFKFVNSVDTLDPPFDWTPYAPHNLDELDTNYFKMKNIQYRVVAREDI